MTNIVKSSQDKLKQLETHVDTNSLELMLNFLKFFIEHVTPEKQFLTRQETCDYLGITPASLHNWISDGLIQPYYLKSKPFFKTSELFIAASTCKQENIITLRANS